MSGRNKTASNRGFFRHLQRYVIGGIGALALALAILPTSGNVASAQGTLNCSAPGGFPNPGGNPILAQFNVWGPTAICAVAASTTALTANINNANTVFLTSTSAFVGSPPGDPNTPAGGIWIRAIGGTTDTSAQGTFTIPVAIAGFSAVNVGGKQRSNFGGVQAGMDIARLNMNGTGFNGHLGITGGYLGSHNTDLIGIGTSNTDIPFIGLYGVLTHSSGFFSDFLLRWDWYANSVSNATVGLANQKFNARGISLTSSAGYHMPLANAWFVEPSVGVVWSRVEADALAVPGAAFTVPGFGPTVLPAGMVTFDTVNSLLGRAGVRVGTTIMTSTMAWQPYGVVNIWHEFAGAATAHFTCAPAVGCTFPLDISTTRVGTYGQFGLGVAAQVLQTGWLGYARVDYRKGENLEGWGVALGLRYQWQSAAAAPLMPR